MTHMEITYPPFKKRKTAKPERKWTSDDLNAFTDARIVSSGKIVGKHDFIRIISQELLMQIKINSFLSQ